MSRSSSGVRGGDVPSINEEVPATLLAVTTIAIEAEALPSVEKIISQNPEA